MNPVDVFWDRCEGPVVFGVNDCCMATADVIVAAGGPDCMARYRGRYRTALGFARAFRRAGFATLAEACEAAMAVGVRVDVPAEFDVAMIAYPRGRERRMVQSPAFFHGGFWHVRTEAGGLVLDHSAFEGSPNIYRLI